jgi:hypothetical protein
VIIPHEEEGEIRVDLNRPPNAWRRSTFCASGACVEVAKADESYMVRDSKDPEGPVLTFNQGEWDAFVAGVRAGEFTFN